MKNINAINVKNDVTDDNKLRSYTCKNSNAQNCFSRLVVESTKTCK